MPEGLRLGQWDRGKGTKTGLSHFCEAQADCTVARLASAGSAGRWRREPEAQTMREGHSGHGGLKSGGWRE